MTWTFLGLSPSCVIDLLFEDVALPIHRPGELLQLPAMVMVMETSSHGRGRLKLEISILSMEIFYKIKNIFL